MPEALAARQRQGRAHPRRPRRYKCIGDTWGPMDACLAAREAKRCALAWPSGHLNAGSVSFCHGL